MKRLARGKSLVVAGALTLVTILTACGTTVSRDALPGEIDVRKLDTGSYTTEPPNAHDDDVEPPLAAKPEIAAMRLADFVATAYDVDPRMHFGFRASAIGREDIPAELGPAAPMTSVAKRNKLLFGFGANGSDRLVTVSATGWPTKNDPDTTTVFLSVMQFLDAEHARRAAVEFNSADFDAFRDQNQSVSLAKYPDALAHWRPGSSFLRSVLSHNSYVITTLVSTPSSEPTALTKLAERAYDTQIPLIDQLPPLTADQLLTAPWDPDKLVARTLNPNQIVSPSNPLKALYGQRGFLQFARDRDLAKNQISAMKAHRIAMLDGTVVARTEDNRSARQIIADRITLTPIKNDADSPPDLPSSACVENQVGQFSWPLKRFTCVVAYRQYVGFVHSDQLIDAHQRAAAQYALFANTR